MRLYDSMRTYTYGYTRLKKAEGEGFHAERDGSLHLEGNDCRIFLKSLDGVDESCLWGRLHMDVELARNSILTVYAAAGRHGKETCIGPFINQTDILLCDLSGRYLWIWMEIKNAGNGIIRNIQVYSPGMEFLQMMPEVYQERGSVLHRYLSIFSTVYWEVQKKIDHMAGLADVHEASVHQLSLLEEWLGIWCGDGLLSEAMTRKLLAQTAHFGRIRGTRKVVEELTILLSGEKPKIFEKKSGTLVLLLCQNITEELERKLVYFLLQFLPKECRLHIISEQDPMGMDEYCYMDVNAMLALLPIGGLDLGDGLEQCVME